jgi:hypothetical protein
MSEGYLQNHVVSAALTRLFADENDELWVRNRRSGAKYRSRPEAVTRIKNFWGVDEAERRAIEQKLDQIERCAPPAIDELIESWRQSGDSEIRGTIAEFIAIHLMRNAAARRRHEALSDEILRQKEADLRESLGEHFDEFMRMQQSPSVISGSLMDQVRLATAMIGSMHWVMIEFDRPLLATADHPLFIVPNVWPGAELNVQAAPSIGILNTRELQFNLDPQHCLLMTWYEGPDPEEPVVGSFREAANINRALFAQTDIEFVYGCHYEAPVVAPPENIRAPIVPLSGVYLPSYGYADVLRSQRREATSRNLDLLIDDPTEKTIRIVVAATQ